MPTYADSASWASSSLKSTTATTANTASWALTALSASSCKYWNSSSFGLSTLNGVAIGSWVATPYKLVVNGVGQATSQIIGSELGGYVLSNNHKMQIIATGTTTPLMIQGGSGVIEIWKDTSPSKANSIGGAVPGFSLSDDLVFSRFSGVGWAETVRIQNASSNVGISDTNPSQKLSVNGNIKTNGFGTKIRHIYGNSGSVESTDHTLICNTSGSAITLYLSSSFEGQEYIFKAKTTNGFPVIISGSIDSTGGLTLVAGQSVIVQYSSGSWYRLS